MQRELNGFAGCMLKSYLIYTQQAKSRSGELIMNSPHPQPRRRVEVCLSAEERSQLKALAKQAGVSMSGYMRAACFGQPITIRVTDVAIATYRDLGKLSDALNQLLPQAQGETHQLIQELLTLLHQIRAEIAGIRSTESKPSPQKPIHSTSKL
jgi:hypothetical protein